MPSYATPADVIASCDYRILSDRLSDTGTPVCTVTQIKNGTCPVILATNPNLLNLIAKASGMVLTACRVANRYFQSDLDAIYADPSRSPQLIDVVVNLTIGLVASRRGYAQREVGALAPRYAEALEFLEMLKRGDRVFDDAPPDGTDAPTAGAEVETIAAAGGPVINGQIVRSNVPACILWTNQVPRIFPGPNNGGGGGW